MALRPSITLNSFNQIFAKALEIDDYIKLIVYLLVPLHLSQSNVLFGRLDAFTEVLGSAGFFLDLEEEMCSLAFEFGEFFFDERFGDIGSLPVGLLADDVPFFVIV